VLNESGRPINKVCCIGVSGNKPETTGNKRSFSWLRGDWTRGGFPGLLPLLLVWLLFLLPRKSQR